MNVRHECYGKVHQLLKGCRLIDPRIAKGKWIVWVGSTNTGAARVFEFDYYEDETAAEAAATAMQASDSYENDDHESRASADHHYKEITIQQCRAICARFEKYMQPDEDDDGDPIGDVLNDFEMVRINESSGEPESFKADCTIGEHEGGNAELYTLEYMVDGRYRTRSLSRAKVKAALEKQNDPQMESNEDAPIRCEFAPITARLCAELPEGAEMGRNELSAREVHEVARLAGLKVPAVDAQAMRYAQGQERTFWLSVGMQAMAMLEAALLIPYANAGDKIVSPQTVARAAEAVKKMIKPAATPGPIDTDSGPRTPRYDALHMRVKDDGDWEDTVESIVTLAEPSRAQLILKHASTRRGCVERFLSRFKDRTEPLVLSAGPDLDMGACIARKIT